MVIDARDRIDEVAERFRGLGFSLSPRGRHSLGSVNHLVLFAGAYLELLGWEAGASAPRPDIAAYPVGLNGLVLASDDAAATHRQLQARGVAAEPPQEFFRPVALDDGRQAEARFRTVRLPPDALPGVRLYFCQHLTPELVWGAAPPAHANGATDISRLVLIETATGSAEATLARIAGDAFRNARIGDVRLDIMDPARFAAEFGAAPDAAGRPSFLGALGFRTRSLELAERSVAGAADVTHAAGRLLVPPSESANVALEFRTA